MGLLRVAVGTGVEGPQPELDAPACEEEGASIERDTGEAVAMVMYVVEREMDGRVDDMTTDGRDQNGNLLRNVDGLYCTYVVLDLLFLFLRVRRSSFFPSFINTPPLHLHPLQLAHRRAHSHPRTPSPFLASALSYRAHRSTTTPNSPYPFLSNTMPPKTRSKQAEDTSAVSSAVADDNMVIRQRPREGSRSRKVDDVYDAKL